MQNELSDVNLIAALLKRIQRSEDSDVLACEGLAMTGTQVLSEISKRCEALQAQGLTRGARIAIFNGRANSFWLDTIAVWCFGGVVVPLLDSDDDAALEDFVTRTEAEYALGRISQTDRLTSISSDRCYNLDEATDADSDVVAPDLSGLSDDRLAMLTFTSGSTSKPKIVPLTASKLLANAKGTLLGLPYKSDDRILAPIPFRFISSISHALCTMLQGACFIGIEEPLSQTELIARANALLPTAFGGSPLQMRWLIEAAEAGKLKASFRWAMSSGDAFAPELLARLNAVMPDCEMMIVYGLTELSGRFCMSSKKIGNSFPRTVGTPISGLTMKILDEGGNELPPGQMGRVIASGQQVFNGYHNNPEVNARVMLGIGFDTGDIGRIAENGELELVGRSDDVFKSAGLKVSTVLIAQEVMKLGLFSDAAVRPEDAEGIGLVPVLYGVLKSPETRVTRGHVLKGLRGQLPNNHLPRELVILPSIPRTGSGKLDRRKFNAQVDALKAR